MPVPTQSQLRRKCRFDENGFLEHGDYSLTLADIKEIFVTTEYRQRVFNILLEAGTEIAAKHPTKTARFALVGPFLRNEKIADEEPFLLKVFYEMPPEETDGNISFQRDRVRFLAFEDWLVGSDECKRTLDAMKAHSETFPGSVWTNLSVTSVSA